MTDPAMTGPAQHERVVNDAYWTPTWCVEALFADSQTLLPVVGDIWEPATGIGTIADVCRLHAQVRESDIWDYGRKAQRIDFLSADVIPWRDVTTIVTNPPYKLAEAFVRHAIALTRPVRGSVAMLLRNEWDCAAGRQALFDAPFAEKLVLTRRPRWNWPGKGGDIASPRHNFSWFIWDWRHQEHAVISYQKPCKITQKEENGSNSD